MRWSFIYGWVPTTTWGWALTISFAGVAASIAIYQIWRDR